MHWVGVISCHPQYTSLVVSKNLFQDDPEIIAVATVAAAGPEIFLVVIDSNLHLDRVHIAQSHIIAGAGTQLPAQHHTILASNIVVH